MAKLVLRPGGGRGSAEMAGAAWKRSDTAAEAESVGAGGMGSGPAGRDPEGYRFEGR